MATIIAPRYVTVNFHRLMTRFTHLPPFSVYEIEMDFASSSRPSKHLAIRASRHIARARSGVQRHRETPRSQHPPILQAEGTSPIAAMFSSSIGSSPFGTIPPEPSMCVSENSPLRPRLTGQMAQGNSVRTWQSRRCVGRRHSQVCR